MYVFYHPDNLKILGMSDQPNALEFPYLEISEFSFTTDCIQVVKNGEALKLEKSKREIKPEKFFEKEDSYAERKKSKLKKLDTAKRMINSKLQEKSLKLDDIVDFINKYL